MELYMKSWNERMESKYNQMRDWTNPRHLLSVLGKILSLYHHFYEQERNWDFENKDALRIHKVVDEG